MEEEEEDDAVVGREGRARNSVTVYGYARFVYARSSFLRTKTALETTTAAAFASCLPPEDKRILSFYLVPPK